MADIQKKYDWLEIRSVFVAGYGEEFKSVRAFDRYAVGKWGTAPGSVSVKAATESWLDSLSQEQQESVQKASDRIYEDHQNKMASHLVKVDKIMGAMIKRGELYIKTPAMLPVRGKGGSIEYVPGIDPKGYREMCQGLATLQGALRLSIGKPTGITKTTGQQLPGKLVVVNETNVSSTNYREAGPHGEFAPVGAERVERRPQIQIGEGGPENPQNGLRIPPPDNEMPGEAGGGESGVLRAELPAGQPDGVGQVDKLAGGAGGSVDKGNQRDEDGDYPSGPEEDIS